MQLATRRVYTGRVISLDLDTVQFPDGSSGELEMIRHPGAAAVVPVLSDWDGPDPVILLLRQFRFAAGGTLWEIPAGRLADPAEDPADCARRELLEEAGVMAGRIERLTTVWTTPGFTDERIHLFEAHELEPGRLAHEQAEVIEVHEFALEAAFAMVERGEIVDAKTIAALFHALRRAPGSGLR